MQIKEHKAPKEEADMKVVTLPGFGKSQKRIVTIGLVWDDRGQCWLAVVNDPDWRCAVAKDAEQRGAIRKAVDLFHSCFDGYSKEKYPHEQVWEAYCDARQMPSSPIISIPV
jgi:hypothetical protein